MIENIEFFSGAPEQGHWPVLLDIVIPVKYNNLKRCVRNYKMANWEEISIQLENIMVENMDSMITEAPTKALLIFMRLMRGVCENSIPRKTLCKYSKAYWSNKMTHLSKKLKDARKKYRLQCNPKNKNIVEMAKIEFKKEMKKNITRWTQNGIMAMNEESSKTSFDDIRKFNGSMDSNNIGVLRHKGKTLEKDCHKTALFQRIFFDGAQLTGKLFDNAFYEKTKVEVKEKLAHTVGDYYKEEVKNDLNMRITMNELKQAIKKRRQTTRAWILMAFILNY